jgi:hypothetical protein
LSQRERKSPLALIVLVIDEPALRAYSWVRESDVLVRPRVRQCDWLNNK